MAVPFLWRCLFFMAVPYYGGAFFWRCHFKMAAPLQVFGGAVTSIWRRRYKYFGGAVTSILAVPFSRNRERNCTGELII